MGDTIESDWPGSCTRDEWLRYWLSDDWKGDVLSKDDVVVDVQRAAREINRLVELIADIADSPSGWAYDRIQEETEGDRT